MGLDATTIYLVAPSIVEIPTVHSNRFINRRKINFLMANGKYLPKSIYKIKKQRLSCDCDVSMTVFISEVILGHCAQLLKIVK